MPSLIRFNNGPFVQFDSTFNPLFSELSQSAKDQSSFRPRLDLHTSKDSNVVTATFDLPGFTSDNVSIDVQNNRLTVSGESDTSGSHEEGGYVVRERHCGKFSRTIRLPMGTKPDDVEAKMENGLLTVMFPRETLEQQIHQIAIR